MPLRSDPGRLPRRNHYQEGPGFLFVATQGGRPPGRRTARRAWRPSSGAAAGRSDDGPRASRYGVGAPGLRLQPGDAVPLAGPLRGGWHGGLVDRPRLGRASELDRGPRAGRSSRSAC